MEVAQLQRSFLECVSVLFQQGILDAHFSQLQMLQDETNPDFVFEVVSLFFEDSERHLNELAKALEQQNVDFKKIDAEVHQLKGSSSSIGAHRVRNACITFRNFCEFQNVEGCLQCLQQVKEEYLLVKAKLEMLLQLERKIVSAGGSIPVLNQF